MIKAINQITGKLPGEIGRSIELLPESILDNLEEIRLRAGQDIKVISDGREYIINNKISTQNLSVTLNNLLNYSYYAYEEELAKGYLTIEGGHRVGVCGRVVLEKGQVRLIKDISSLNIRCCKEFPGISDVCVEHIIKGPSEIYNTLIVSPPKCGKTTLLRDIIRNLSTRGMRISVCDERSELSGIYMGLPSFDMGPNTDILDACPKADGISMLIRSMSPDVVATDEIGKKEDIKAIEAAACAGCGLLTTIHGSSFEDACNSGIGPAIEEGFFKRFFFLSNSPKTGTISEVRYE